MKSLLVCFAAAGSVCVAIASPEYSVVDLGVLPGYDSTAVQSVSANGIVTGYCSGPDGTQGFIWQNGVMTGIGVDSDYSASEGLGVNSAGVIVGGSISPGYASFTLSGGVRTYLDPLVVGKDVYAQAINEAGQVVGHTNNAANNARGVLWTGSVATELAPIVGTNNSAAFGLNNFGNAAGLCFQTGGLGHATVWIGGTAVDLGLAGGSWSQAADINDFGAAVGAAERADGNHAILWQGGTFTDLNVSAGSNDCFAVGINNAGQVLGFAGGKTGLWHDGAYDDLESLLDASGAGWTIDGPADISDGGFIVFEGKHNGVITSGLLVPVPEPATLAALGLGVLALRRRKR